MEFRYALRWFYGAGHLVLADGTTSRSCSKLQLGAHLHTAILGSNSDDGSVNIMDANLAELAFFDPEYG